MDWIWPNEPSGHAGGGVAGGSRLGFPMRRGAEGRPEGVAAGFLLLAPPSPSMPQSSAGGAIGMGWNGLDRGFLLFIYFPFCVCVFPLLRLRF